MSFQDDSVVDPNTTPDQKFTSMHQSQNRMQSMLTPEIARQQLQTQQMVEPMNPFNAEEADDDNDQAEDDAEDGATEGPTQS